MKKVVLTFNSMGDLDEEREVFKGFAEIVKIPCKTEEDLIENCKDADAVICCYEPFTARVMDNLPNLKVISFKAIGVNYVDLNAAKERNIAVTNIPQYCVNEVADHTVAFILCINRRIVQFHKSVQQDKAWKYDLCPDMTRFSECTVGLLGFGNISRLLAARLKGFGPRMIAYDPFVSQKQADEYGVKLVELGDLYETADYISCHLPLNKSTEKTLNSEAFAKMKTGVVLINTSRGGVIDEEALVAALDSGKVGFAALDVLTEERPDMGSNPFRGRDNVILTPHVAFYSLSAVRDAKVQSAENILYYLKGEYEKCHIVNGVNKSDR